ncbi:hypothetical protein EJB05_37239, partial [Eragrostis curvula]
FTMENDSTQNNNNGHDLNVAIETDDTTDLIWYDMDALLGVDDNDASNDHDVEGGRDNSHESEASSSKAKRHKAKQILALESLFQSCSHPDDETRRALGTKIGMDPQQIKNWFQNKRSQNKLKSCWDENREIRSINTMLQDENFKLRQRILEQSCFSCHCHMSPPQQLSEKQRLLIENARLKEQYLRAQATLRELTRGTPRPLVMPSFIVASDGNGTDTTLLLQHAERAMKEFQELAAAGAPVWLPSIDGDVLNYREYTTGVFPGMLGPCPQGFVSEATREAAIVWGTAADIVGILTDPGRWSEMFPGIVAAVSARDVGFSGTLSSRDGLILLMNAELWVQSPRMPNRSVKFLRFTKMTANGQHWAVVDVSVDGVVGQEGEPRAQNTRCRLLPSGCLIENMGGDYCKVTWIVHAEYDEATVVPLFKPLLRSGQALGARRWLPVLKRQCEYKGVLKNFPAGDGRKGVMEVAKRMTASFYAAISGPVTLPGSRVREWRGAALPVRMVIWNCAGVVPGHPDSRVLSATTTVWLPSTQPCVVLDYLRNERRRGEWDVLARGAAVTELGYIITGNVHGNAVSILRPNVTDDGTNNNKILILQEACSDPSCSLVVYSPVEKNVTLALMRGGNPVTDVLLPSGFAILPDGYRKIPHASSSSSSATSTSTAPAGGNTTSAGCLLTAAYQTLWSGPPADDNLAAGAFDAIGKQLCNAIESIKAAVGAEVIIPA